MIVTKTFSFSGSIGSSKTLTLSDGYTAAHYPTWGRFVVDCLNEVLESFGTYIEYDADTAKASMNGAHFWFPLTATAVKLYVENGNEAGYGNSAINFGGGTYYHMVITVKGTQDSFEVQMAGGSDLGTFYNVLGKYNFKRLSDGKILTALRVTGTSGKFWVFEDDSLLELALVIKPSSTYAYSDFTYPGYALVPAIPTNFAYQISDAFLYCPMLESGAYYTIAGESVVAVQSCILLKC